MKLELSSNSLGMYLPNPKVIFLFVGYGVFGRPNELAQ